jgi:hypothetical protein
MSNFKSDNHGELPPGLDYFHNLLSPPGPLMQALKRKPKRQPIVAIRKDPDSPYYPWIWSCQICPGEPDLGTNFDKCVDWENAFTHARNHARNHRRS